VIGLVLNICGNLCLNKHLRLDFRNPMTVDWSAFCSKRRSFHHPLTISIRYFQEGILVMANRNTEKIPVSVVFSTQHIGEEMPVPVNSTSALNHWGCYFCARTEIGSGSSVDDLPSIDERAKQELSVMRKVSFSPLPVSVPLFKLLVPASEHRNFYAGWRRSKISPATLVPVRARKCEYSRPRTGSTRRTDEHAKVRHLFSLRVYAVI
jgi:hypothetical protein